MSQAPEQSAGIPAVAFDPTHVPEALRELPQWVAWRYEERDGKPTKVPVNPHTGKRASSTRSSTWGTFDEAVAACRAGDRCVGVGFVFAADNRFTGVDLDGCIDESGSIVSSAREIIDSLSSYTEVSPSGRGVKVFIAARKPDGARCRSKVIEGFKEAEVYDRARFFAVTARQVPGTPPGVEERQTELEELCARLWPRKRPRRARVRADPAGFDGDDEAIIEQAGAAKNGDRFKTLWAGDTSMHGGDHSAADQALCNLLAFWTGRDAERMDRLFRRSGLFRDKWDERRGDRTYGQMTVERAIADCAEVFSPGRGRPGGAAPSIGKPAADTSDSASDASISSLMTDVGNAARLVRRERDRIRFCYGPSRWLVWDGKRWRPDERGRIVKLCKATALAILDEAKQAVEEQRQALVKWAMASQKRDRLTAMAALAQPEVAVGADELDADPWAFNVLNGTIDVRTGELRPHRRDDLITKVAPVEYDPQAKAPRFEQFLDEIFAGDRDLIRFVQRWHGHCLSADVREQYLLIYHGEGNNGKSVLLDTISAIMGDYASEAPPDLITVRKHPEHPTEIADLLGKRLVIASETEHEAELRLQLIKRLTGNARLKARLMRQDYFEFDRTHKMILVTNNKPSVKEGTEAVWRRLRLVPFDVVIPKADRDPDLMRKLWDERAGILAWLVQGCVEWLGEGLTEPDAVPEPPDDPVTKPGDLWVLGDHRLLCGDSASEADVDRLLDWQRVHLVKKINPNAMVHLTEKPVELAARAMQYSSRPGEHVLDLFGGSGSTLIAAEQTGRKAFLLEIDPAYCDVIVQRWEQFTGRKAERISASAHAEETPATSAAGEGQA